jgi:hypothetical protein
MSKEFCFYVNDAFMSASPGLLIMSLKDFGNSMPISNNEQGQLGTVVFQG